MTSTNGHSQRVSSLFFALVDGLLIVTGVLAGTTLRFWGLDWSDYLVQHFTLTLTAMVLVIQVAFYYFDLYEFKSFSEMKTVPLLLVKSLAVSAITLAVLQYLIPTLALGRGIMTISLGLIFVFAFLWRLCFIRLSRAKHFRERILIIGTGNLAKKINEEITQNGYDGFEIVGFIDENSEKFRNEIGERI